MSRLPQPFKMCLLTYQNGERHAPDHSLRNVCVLHDAAGLVRDVFGPMRRSCPRRGLIRRMRKVGGRAGDTSRSRTLAIILSLLGADHHRLIRIESFFLLLATGKVAIDGSAGAEVVRAEQRFERGADLVDKVAFNLLPDFERLTGDLGIVV